MRVVAHKIKWNFAFELKNATIWPNPMLFGSKPTLHQVLPM
jgi:hypothetical protein